MIAASGRTLAVLTVPLCAALVPHASYAQGIDPEPSDGDEAPARETSSPPASSTDVALASAPAASHFELTARGTYTTTPVQGAVTPFGLGGGVGLDVSLGHALLGVAVLGYWGGSDSSGNAESAVLYGGEAGYEIRLAPAVTLRPMVGLGAARISFTIASSTPQSASVPLTTTGRSRNVASPVDVITQSSSIGAGGGGGTGGGIADSIAVSSLFVAPALMTVFEPSAATLASIGGRVLYLPKVSYGGDMTAKWLSCSLDVDVGVRF